MSISPPAGRLAGKVALVTGASRGIGAAIATRLALDGAAVVVNYVANSAAAQGVVDAIEASGGTAATVQADVGQVGQARALVAEALRQFGRLDILVNNAAIAEGVAFEAIDEILFDRHFDTNVKAMVFLVQAAADALATGGGVVINLSSIGTRAANPRTMIYAATKAAVEMLTISLSRELGPRGVRVNAVAPGQIETDMLRKVIPAAELEANIARVSLGRLGRPGDIADVVAFLASDAGRWITGETIHVSGGQRLNYPNPTRPVAGASTAKSA